MIKDNLFTNMESSDKNIFILNPRFKINNYNKKNEAEYKLIIDYNLILDIYRFYYGAKNIKIEPAYKDLLYSMKIIYMNTLYLFSYITYENDLCLINIYNFIIRNDIYYGHNIVLVRFQNINQIYEDFAQRNKKLRICSIKEGEIYISSISNDEENSNKIILCDENLNIPDYIYWKKKKKKGKYFLQKTDNFYILQPSYSYSMAELNRLNISAVKSKYVIDRHNELLYYKKKLIYKCDIHTLIDYCKKNGIKLKVEEEVLLLDGFFIGYIPDDLTHKLKFDYGEKEYFSILNILYLQHDYNTKIYNEKDNIIDDVDSNEISQINIINNKSIRMSSNLDGNGNNSLYFDHENVCYNNKYNIINKIFHDSKYIKNKFVDIPKNVNYFDFIDEFNWQLELFSHIKIFGLRNPIFYVFLYKYYILDVKYRDHLPEEMIEKYNKEFLLYVNNNNVDEILAYLKYSDADIIISHIKKEMEIFNRDCKIFDLILFGGIASYKKLTVPPNWFVWDMELDIIFREYVLINPELKENNRKENLEMEPDADKLNYVKEKLREPYAYLYICVRGGIVEKYIILETIDASYNKRKILTREEYTKKFKKFNEKKKLNIEIRFVKAFRANYMAYNMYNFWFFIEPPKPKNCYLLYYQDKWSQKKNVCGEKIIKKFNELDQDAKDYFLKYEKYEYLLYNYLFYRYTQFQLYMEKNLKFDYNLMEENIEKKYQTKYTRNYKEAFLLFFIDKINLIDELDEDLVEDFLQNICKEWSEMDNDEYQNYLKKEEEDKKRFIEDNKNYRDFIDLIRKYI